MIFTISPPILVCRAARLKGSDSISPLKCLRKHFHVQGLNSFLKLPDKKSLAFNSQICSPRMFNFLCLIEMQIKETLSAVL